MDDKAIQALKNMEGHLEELKSISNLLERVVQSNQSMEKSLREMREIYENAVHQARRQ